MQNFFMFLYIRLSIGSMPRRTYKSIGKSMGVHDATFQKRASTFIQDNQAVFDRLAKM